MITKQVVYSVLSFRSGRNHDIDAYVYAVAAVRKAMTFAPEYKRPLHFREVVLFFVLMNLTDPEDETVPDGLVDIVGAEVDTTIPSDIHQRTWQSWRSWE